MARFHAVTWQEGNFDRTASVLSFDSKAARAAYPAQCAQRVKAIDYKQMTNLVKEGRSHRLVLLDSVEPTKFSIHA